METKLLKKTNSLKGNWFEFLHEVLNQSPESSSDVKKFYDFKMGTGNGLWPRLNDSAISWIKKNGYSVMLNLNASVEVLEKKQVESDRLKMSPEDIESEKVKIRDLTEALGCKIWWDIMPEWDQTGGYWANYDKPKADTPRKQAYNDWKNYFFSLNPLGSYLKSTREERGFNAACVCDYTYSTHYAFEWGLDMVLIERDIDELGDIATGIAFLRGAARQYDRPWGIDISEWSTNGNSATEYNDNMQRIGGWSESYHKRHIYLSYMSGANMIHLEPCYLFNNGKVNPFGQIIEDFANFSLNRHIDRGIPYVPTAIMLDFYHGFQPKCGRWGQKNAVWYQRIPYEDGDYMIDNFLQMAYPGFNKSGTYGGAPWSNAEEFKDMLLKGMNTEPYEHMGKSKWGYCFDVLLNNATLEALNTYKVIILLGDVTIDSQLKGKLQSWVKGGGTLVINEKQVTLEDEAFLGIKLSDIRRESYDSIWLSDNEQFSESEYEYRMIIPEKAKVIAANSKGDALITKNIVGNGQVYLTAPAFLQDKEHKGILCIGERLVGELNRKFALVEVDDPELQLEYAVNTNEHEIIVTVVNNSGKTWKGNISFIKTANDCSVTEWIEDEEVLCTMYDKGCKVYAEIPAFDLKVFSCKVPGLK